MQHVLVHLDHDLGPIGAWSYSEEGLKHFYPESLDLAISARARDAMASRPLDTPVPDWFLTVHHNHVTALDAFDILEVEDEHSLPAILAAYRKGWNENAKT